MDEHQKFLLEEERKLRETHSIFPWQGLGMSGPPTLIHGLGVVVNRKGKKRLIVDARYLNLFLRYLALKYESLADAIAQLQQGDYMWLTDFNSGYHQVPMHPNTYQYLGLEIAGRIYIMPFLPFG